MLMGVAPLPSSLLHSHPLEHWHFASQTAQVTLGKHFGSEFTYIFFLIELGSAEKGLKCFWAFH